METKPRILVLGRNYLTAEALCDLIRAEGCDIVGSAGDVPSAVEFMHSREIDGAIVDINLHGDSSLPVCEELKRLKVPFVFLCGHDHSPIPQAFANYRLLSKPVGQDALKLALAEFAATRPRDGDSFGTRRGGWATPCSTSSRRKRSASCNLGSSVSRSSQDRCCKPLAWPFRTPTFRLTAS